MHEKWLTVLDTLFFIVYLASLGCLICRSAHIPDAWLELLTNIGIALFLLYFAAYTFGLIFYRSSKSKPSCMLKFGYILSIIAVLMLIF